MRPKIDGSAAGFVLEGAADADDASFAVIATSNVDVYVEVHDDAIVATGTEADALDVWLAVFSRVEPIEYCEPGNATTEVPVHFRIGVADGAITTIRGALPPGLSAEVASGASPRLHIKLPPETDFHPFYGASLALAYRDSDDGSTVERVIATSRIRTGGLAEIGRVYEAPLDLRCALRTGRLERNRPARDPLRPLAP